MVRISLVTAACLAVTTLGARQASPPPALPAYAAQFLVGADGQAYSGTTTFAVDAKGVVSGKMTLTAPTNVTGTLLGPVKDGTWTVQIDFSMVDQGCQGTVTGTAKVPTDLKVVSGTVTVSGACTPDPQSATFTFTKK